MVHNKENLKWLILATIETQRSPTPWDTYGNKTAAGGHTNGSAASHPDRGGRNKSLLGILAEQLPDDHGFSVTTAATLDAAGGLMAENTRLGPRSYSDIRGNAGWRRVSLLRQDSATGPFDADHHADRLSRRNGCGSRPGFGCKRLHCQTVSGQRTGCASARAAASVRSSEDAVFSVGPYTFRPAKKLLHEPINNRRIRLTGKESAILKFLYRSDSRPVDRQILLHEVWGYNPAVTTHTLETHIYRLRQKMERHPRNPVLLLTENGGYRLSPGMVWADGVLCNGLRRGWR